MGARVVGGKKFFLPHLGMLAGRLLTTLHSLLASEAKNAVLNAAPLLRILFESGLGKHGSSEPYEAKGKALV